MEVCLSVLIKFSNLWPPSHDCSACTIKFAVGVNLKTHYQTNCNECATAFTAGVNLKRHDTLRGTVSPTIYWPTQPSNPRDSSGLCNCFLCQTMYQCQTVNQITL